jgi:hypothetical protein
MVVPRKVSRLASQERRLRRVETRPGPATARPLRGASIQDRCHADLVREAEREARLAAGVRSLAELLQNAGRADLVDRLHEDADRVESGERYRLDVLWTDLGRDEWPSREVSVLAERLRAEAHAINRTQYGGS